MTGPSSSPPPRRLLVLRPRALGDVLLATPALRALRAGFPAAEIHVAVDDLLAPVLRRNPHVDRLWLLPRRRPVRRRDWWPIYSGLARAGFDLVLDLHGSPRTAVLARLTGAPVRVGYALRGRGRLYTVRIPRDTDRTGRRVAQYAARTNLDIVARLGVTGPALDDATLVLPPEPGAEARIASVVASFRGGPMLVGLAPAGTWQAKTWPPESWAALGEALAGAGATPLLLWGPGEEATARAVQAAMRAPAILAPPTDLDELAALAGRLALLVCHDSGIKHVAVARDTPTLTLYGPTNPRAWSPPGDRHAGLRARLPCLECNRTRCVHHLCMTLLDPAAVAARALELAGRGTGGGEPACAS